jgi:glycosyltransferase involved in cell wall biosynthesis
MRVAELTPSLSRRSGGLFESVRHLAKTVHTSGHAAISVIGLEDEQTAQDVGQWQPVLVRTFATVGPSQFGWAPALRRYLANENLDLLHIHGLWTYLSIAALQWRKQTSKPYVVSPRGMLEPWALKQSSMRKTIALWVFQRAALRQAACLHATSVEEAQNLRHLGFTNPIAVIPNGVDMPSAPAEIPRSEQIRYALFLSRLHPKKGLLNLVQAWNAVRANGWMLLVAGPDENNHLQEVKALVQRLDLEQQVTFLGDVRGNQKSEVYRRADLFVLPSFSENFGLVIAEALSFGIPVITTRATPWEDLETRKCGWWIDVGSASLVQALSEATSSSVEQLREIGARGRKLVAEKYNWDRIAQQMLEVYEWLTGKCGRPESVV